MVLLLPFLLACLKNTDAQESTDQHLKKIASEYQGYRLERSQPPKM